MRVLFLTHRLPYAPNRGDRVRAYHLLLEMRRWADVDLVSLVHDGEEASHAADLHGLASSVRVAPVSKRSNFIRGVVALPSSRPLTHTLLHSPALRPAVEAAAHAGRPDVVLAFCTGIAPIALEKPLNAVPLVVDMVDVDSAKWAALARSARPPLRWIYQREARLLARFEQTLAAHADTTILTTGSERDELRRLAPNARIEVIQNGVDAEALRPPDAATPSETVVFCGVMDYAPNAEGAAWMAREVWPIVRRERPAAHFQIVGSSPTPSVLALADPRAGIEVTGRVPDVRPYLWRAALSVAPLRTAHGIQNKVLEAVAAGLPVVVTPAVFKGLPVEVHPACISASTAADFAARVIERLGEAPTHRRDRARQSDVCELSWERRLTPLRQILDDASAHRSR